MNRIYRKFCLGARWGSVLVLCGIGLPSCRNCCDRLTDRPHAASVGAIVNGRRYVRVESGVICAPIVIKDINTWVVPDDWTESEQ